jgi:hypothetical protein
MSQPPGVKMPDQLQCSVVKLAVFVLGKIGAFHAAGEPGYDQEERHRELSVTVDQHPEPSHARYLIA